MNNETKHFKSNVPESTIEKMHAFAELVQDQFDSELFTSSELIMESNIDNISGVGYDGFIPFQDGGYTVSSYCRCDTDTSYHETAKQTECMNQYYDQCVESFKMDNDIESEEIPEDKLELFYDYESEWFDCAVADVRIWIDGQDILIDMGINYKDGPYFREKYAEKIAVIEITLDDFMQSDNTELIKRLIATRI